MTSETGQPKHLIPPGESPFRHDNWLGRILQADQEFLLEDGFMSFEEAVREIKASGKKVILNAGDSSTSGWDTRVTVENKQRVAAGQPLLSAFFRYSTYSDMLRAELGADYVVLNAGIPGHTTLQGRRRVDDLLKRFSAAGVQVNYLTLYFGNNDSQWEGNVEDRHKLLATTWLPLAIERRLAARVKPDYERLHLRTSRQDFQANFRAMIRSSRRHGAVPILILPETPLYWEPGTRFVEENYQLNEESPGYRMVTAALERSRELWSGVIGEGCTPENLGVFEQARELDFIVPRIKRDYRDTITSVAREEDTPLVTTSIPRDEDDVRYFVDYCHPVNEANEMLANGVAEKIRGVEDGSVLHNRVERSLLLSMLDSPVFDYLSTKLGGRGARPRGSGGDVNEDIYTLY